jgi:hypothetical protein
MKRTTTHRKIGRNAPCWCGSGKKYKKCHLSREDEAPIQLWQIDKEFKRVLEQRQCLAPSAWRQSCSPQMSRAHTVPRSGSLARIARDGHVYSFRVRVQDLVKTGRVITPQLLGINKASTFTGFCSGHDRSIFAPIETLPFEATPEQCFLLHYRAFVREFFVKHAMASFQQVVRFMDRGRPVEQQGWIQELAAVSELGYSLAAKDSAALKAVCDDILVTRSFHRTRAYVIQLREVPPVMCSGAFYPEQDFQGNQMQDLLDVNWVPQVITVTSFRGGQQGVIALSWVDKDDTVCLPFVTSLHHIGDEALTDALMRLLFYHVENLHIAPQWWEALSTTCRETLVARSY